MVALVLAHQQHHLVAPDLRGFEVRRAAKPDDRDARRPIANGVQGRDQGNPFLSFAPIILPLQRLVTSASCAFTPRYFLRFADDAG